MEILNRSKSPDHSFQGVFQGRERGAYWQHICQKKHLASLFLVMFSVGQI